MNEVIKTAIHALEEKLPNGFDGSVKFEIENEGSVIVNETGCSESSDEADCTLIAFMQGKLKVDGDMGMAMRLASILA